MQSTKNILLSGAENKPMALDIFFENDKAQKPVVIYVHGFNGFKDCGNFDLIAAKFAAAGYVLVKFNFLTMALHPCILKNLQTWKHLATIIIQKNWKILVW